ncbi:SMC-Scp complex subunit ScpB [uncultured Faecalicoccus sp.]|uniref:SMC-Scp complex subunit ScpB n=1 Tax=uncultured Faecalicoccus sp. TaxID=1971760 RepID=UPI0026129BB5|nr:SMC-Scp complex subunit ScpB [uncultured Faecalicoccus sp.]
MNKAIIEGLLFLSGEEGLTLEQIKTSLQIEDEQAILNVLQNLKEEYQSPEKGIELVEYASRYKFVTKEFVYPYGQKLFEQIHAPTLSTAAIETLAIIAYKQPITRVEIEEIRGVNCEMMLKKLQARGLIEAKDRLDAVGKPLLYSITDAFLDAFSLETIKELPQLPQTKQEDELFSEEDQ